MFFSYFFLYIHFLDLITALKKLNNRNLPSICVFLYNCKNGVSCELATESDYKHKTLNVRESAGKISTFDKLTPLCNSNALMNGYLVDGKLMALSRLELGMSLQDFGITILMMFFADFYSKGQYPLYMNTFQCVRQLEIIDKFILSYNQRSIRLPLNLATHKTYGLKAQHSKFTNSGHLTMQLFNSINALMRAATVTPEHFIKSVSMFDLSIIESFYIFTSITKNCKIINECNELKYNVLPFTFQKPETSLRYDGDYWFELPRNAIWFAYHQGQVKYSAYVGCDIHERLKCFKVSNVCCLVVGFLHDHCVYPIIFQDPNLHTNWDATVNYIRAMQFNCVLNTNMIPLPSKNSRIHFVKNGIATIFKYVT